MSVAVTGIPNEQPKHAMIMAVFATECMNKMKELVSMLAGELGQDTLNLQMRIGLNSGSVTAGVLRGDKSRFQLFGDSVNTGKRIYFLLGPMCIVVLVLISLTYSRFFFVSLSQLHVWKLMGLRVVSIVHNRQQMLLFKVENLIG